jgi:hypothetical protein
MDTRVLLLAGAVVVLAGCNQTGSSTATNETANAAASAVKHPTYCFFKDADTKGWSAKRDAQGNITVKGKAHIDDNRYSAALGEPEVSGTSASVWLTMGPNSGATGAPENWWDVTASIANGASVDTVSVMCGKKTVAQLKVPAAS